MTFFPDEHAHFYSQLPFLVAAARDARGRPWPTLLTGEPGFISACDERTLSIQASVPPSDALSGSIEAGSDLGMLGIELHSRRRNRVNGRVRSTSLGEILVDVDQTFGNCPQHIHPRTWRIEKATPTPERGPRFSSIGPDQKRAIEAADTFFIASGHGGSEESDRANPTHGMDVSHRGGPIGFVEVESDKVLVIPDYAGNNHFNTLGNLTVDSRAGLLFVDFVRGSLLQLSGRVQVEWQRPDPVRYPGAQRLLRFSVEEIVEQVGVLPLRWSLPNDKMRPLRVTRRVQESEDVTSLYFESTDRAPVEAWSAGQHLPITVEVGAGATSLQRTYSLSNAPGSAEYRISVKRESAGVVSNHLHDSLQAGSLIYADAPAGEFVLDLERIPASRPILLVAAGIGITPIASMLHAIAVERPSQEVVVVHGIRDQAHHPLASEIRELARELPNLSLHIRCSRPLPSEGDSGSFDSLGRIDVDLLEALADVRAAEVFMCGPAGFMSTLELGLIERGAPEDRVHYEIF